MQIKRQKQNRQDDADDCESCDGEERQFRDCGVAEFENSLGDGHHVVLPFDCHAIWTREI